MELDKLMIMLKQHFYIFVVFHFYLSVDLLVSSLQYPLLLTLYKHILLTTVPRSAAQILMLILEEGEQI
jgi:hypothetical protein